MNPVLIAAGGAPGALARYGLAGWVQWWRGGRTGPEGLNADEIET
jgi:fluoride ion exporter CrcB/FEX